MEPKPDWTEALLSSIRPELHARVLELCAAWDGADQQTSGRGVRLLDAAGLVGQYAINAMEECVREADIVKFQPTLVPLAAVMVAGLFRSIAVKSVKPEYKEFSHYVELLELLTSPDSYVEPNDVPLRMRIQ